MTPSSSNQLRNPASFSPTRDATHITGRIYLLLTGLLLAAAVVAAFVLYVRFSFTIYPSTYFDSDDSVAALFSNEVLEQHSLMPTWNYSTGFLLPLTWPIALILPITLEASQHWMSAYRLAVCLDLLVFSALVWFIAGRAGMSRAMRLFFLCFLVAAPSLDYARQSTLIAGRTWFFVHLLILAWVCFRCLPAPGVSRQPVPRYAMLCGVGILLFVDTSYVSQILPPLVAATTAMFLFDDGTRTVDGLLKRYAGVIGAVLAGALIGQAAGHMLLSGGRVYHPIAPKFVGINTAGDNVLLLLRGIIEWLGAAPPTTQDIYSIAAVACAVKLVVVSAIFLLPLVLIPRWSELQDRFLRFLIVLFSVDLAIRVFVYVYTDVNQNSTDTARYFIPPSLFGLFICLRYAEVHWQPLMVRTCAVAAATVFIFSSPFAVARQDQASWQQKLTQALQQAHLQRGYATWEYADQLTVVSDNTVRVRPVVFTNGGPVPLHFNSTNRWFKGEPDVGRSFLLLKDSQRNTDLSAFSAAFGKPVEIKQMEGFSVLIYPFDIAWKSGWRTEVDAPLPRDEMRVQLRGVGDPVYSADRITWTISMTATNQGHDAFGTTGSWPVQLGSHLLAPDGTLLNHNLSRTWLPVIQPGESVQVSAVLPDSQVRGKIVEFDLVQENVTWFGYVGNRTLRVSIPDALPGISTEPPGPVLRLQDPH